MKMIDLVCILRRMALLVTAVVFLLLSSQIAFSGAEEPEPTVDDRLLSANKRFAFKLFAEIVKQDTGKNVFVSPSSVAMALAMTYNGAEAETKDAMAQTLQLQGMTLEEVNRANATLKAALENLDPEIQLNIANSLWARQGIQFRPDFLARVEDFYAAEVEVLDFKDPAASSVINSWVSQKTSNKITKIIDGLGGGEILFLINAIYFKGTWTVKFDSTETIDREFTLLGGDTKKHPMMHQSGHYQYYKGRKFQAVSLPYGEKTASMYVFLPDRDSNLEEFLDSLNAENWERWVSRFSRMEGDIILPRLRLEYELVCNDVLKALGMGLAFDMGANFTAMTPIQPVWIGEVKHKTFVEVNEEGTEAAAVTSVRMVMTSIEPRPRFNMIVDRPFFCAIVDNRTGTVLFMGAIVEPK